MSAPQQYICVHGHFYQPPRENAWLEAIEVQDSAAPYHDWNERITHECYAANGSSRILNEENKIVRIVNNYSRMSFNFGPTLLAWMEKAAPLTYARILEGDRLSRERFGGHGSAIAQVYNHIILPLAPTRDRITQIRWGIADFEYRFGHRPQGMWLAETAVDLESLDLLAQHGIRFTILAPHQCARIRPIDNVKDTEEPAWQETPRASVDTTQPYLVRTRQGRSIAVFFYNGPLSRAIAFEGLLNNGETLAQRLLQGFPVTNHSGGQLVHVATDGESYGHHHRHGDMALAYAFQWIAQNSDAQLTNYSQFLEMFPPSFEAEIIENTSWSCAHGVERWRSDCGCGGTTSGWCQSWRAPLRKALDQLRDAVRPLWLAAATPLLRSPQTAIDAYIHVLLNRCLESQQRFLMQHALHPPTPAEATRILQLMELERHLQLMYTSCGWFFEDIAGIETVQILSYAGRVLQLSAELFGTYAQKLETNFLAQLAQAQSNQTQHGSGADIYHRTMTTQKTTLEQVGATYAIASLFEDLPERTTEYCYDIHRHAGEISFSGRARFLSGRARVSSRLTFECADLHYAALYLGDPSVVAAVQSSNGTTHFLASVHSIQQAFTQSNLPETLRRFQSSLGADNYSLPCLFRDEQRRILKILLDSTLQEMEQTLRTLYEDHAALLRYLALAGLPQPPSLVLAAQFSLNTALGQQLSAEIFPAAAIRALLSQAQTDQITLDEVPLAYQASQRMLRAILSLEQHRDLRHLEEALEILNTLQALPFPLDLWEAQNRWYRMDQHSPRQNLTPAWQKAFRQLGNQLGIAVDQLITEG